MNTLKLSLVAFACASVFATSYAEDQNCQNQISMQLQEEGWVTSKTALVTVNIQAATSKDSSSKLIAQVTNKLKSIVTDSTPWRLVDLSTEKNPAGLLAISAKMSSRLNNDQVAQLQGAIDTLNKAGEQYKIENIDYQPELAEIAAENTRLRSLIYSDVLEQQKAINTAFTGSGYQLQTLSFDEVYAAPSRPMLAYTANMDSARRTSSPAAAPFSQQLTLNARVTFSSPNLSCEKIDK
ncbi:MAG: hypothetical protein KBD83_04580 [Gammaproteobacteria bacterium]|nr:hypothetical protein [Gammaproteobacteria bacterium]